jgi:hypothetical protein
MRRIALFAVAVGFIAPILASAPAQAQATRTWVSGVGDDVNPCSRTAPCKTFSGAISKTAAAGEINCLDSAGYGTLTITKQMTIRCEGVIASALTSGGTNAFIVNTPNLTDRVVLSGLEFEGLGTALNGIKVVGTGRTVVENCQIRHFSGNGIELVGTAGASVVVSNSLIVNNGGGFNIAGASGAANVGISHDTIYDANPNFGIQAGAGATLKVGGNRITGAATSISAVGAPTIQTWVNNAMDGTSPAMTPITLK